MEPYPGADTWRTNDDIFREVCDPCLSVVGQLFLGPEINLGCSHQGMALRGKETTAVWNVVPEEVFHHEAMVCVVPCPDRHYSHKLDVHNTFLGCVMCNRSMTCGGLWSTLECGAARDSMLSSINSGVL